MRTEKLVNFDILRQMLNDGSTMSECAEYFGIDQKQLHEQCLKYGFNQMEDPTERAPLKVVDGDLLLSWEDIEEYLSTGLSIAEVATAGGVFAYI